MGVIVFAKVQGLVKSESPRTFDASVVEDHTVLQDLYTMTLAAAVVREKLDQA